VVSLTLGVHTDGLVYLFKNDAPVGVGIELPEGGGLYGYVDSENNIVLKGDYSEGTFVKYEMADGTIIDIGEMVFEKEPEFATFTNLFDPSTALLNKRIKSDGSLVDAIGFVTTPHKDIRDKVPFTASTKIYVKGADFNLSSSGDQYAQVVSYKYKATDGGYGNVFSAIKTNSLTREDEGNGVISVTNLAASFASGVTYMALTLRVKDAAITADDIKDIIITIDEPIYK
jgi:hypothetical protein